ncbi:hypothetical protein IAR50_007106 [Cryptococcus sp. DSM 104548]
MPQVDATSQAADDSSRVAFMVSSAVSADGDSIFMPSVYYTVTGDNSRASGVFFGEAIKSKVNGLTQTSWAAPVYGKSNSAESSKALVNTVAEHAQLEENEAGSTFEWSVATADK